MARLMLKPLCQPLVYLSKEVCIFVHQIGPFYLLFFSLLVSLNEDTVVAIWIYTTQFIVTYKIE